MANIEKHLIYADIRKNTAPLIMDRLDNVRIIRKTFKEMRQDELPASLFAIIVKKEDYEEAKKFYYEQGVPVIENTGNPQQIINSIVFHLPKIDLQKSIEPEIVIQEVVRTETKYIEVPKEIITNEKTKLITVRSLSHGAGATTIAMLLAEFFSLNHKETALFEFADKPYIKEFYDLDRSVTTYQNIHFHTHDTNPESVETAYKLQTILKHKNALIKIVDNGTSNDLIENSDATIVVLDPLPSMFAYHYKDALKELTKFHAEHNNVYFVINKVNRFADMKQFKKIFHLPFLSEIPLFDQTEIYRCTYEPMFLLNSESIKENVYSSLQQMAKGIGV